MASNLSQSFRLMNYEVPLREDVSLIKQRKYMMFGVCASLFPDTFFLFMLRKKPLIFSWL